MNVVDDMKFKGSKRQKILNYVGLLLVFIIQVLDNVVREKRWNMGRLGTVKNILLLLIVSLFIAELYRVYKYKGIKVIFKKELLIICKLVLVFIFLSLYYVLKNDVLYIETIDGFIRLLMPVIVAFAVLNIMSEEEIYTIMCAFLIISFIGYLVANVGLSDITFENISNISFEKSYSPFESNFFSPTAMAFCLFFCYYRKHPFFTFMSVFFSIMTFKRIMVLYSIFLLVVGIFFLQKKEVNKRIIFVFKFLFLIITIFYIQLVSGNIIDVTYKYLGIDIQSITMGRSWFIQRIINNGFQSKGFMSSNVEFRGMEMDLPQINLEMGIIAVIATIHYLTELGKSNWYNFLIIIFCLMELLTSHWFDISYFWMIMYITIGCIAYKTDRMKGKKKYKFVLKRRQITYGMR